MKRPAGERLCHVFPDQPGKDQIGARAYCGFRRTRPWSGAYAHEQRGPDQCVFCVEIWEARRG